LDDEKKDISVVLYETSFKKERIKLYSTLPVLCLALEDNCKLEFVLGVIESSEDLFRVSDCGNNTTGKHNSFIFDIRARMSNIKIKCLSALKIKKKLFKNKEITRDYCQSRINKWQTNNFAEWCLISTLDDRNLRISETNSQIKILLYQLNDVYGSNWLLFNLPTINVNKIK